MTNIAMENDHLQWIFALRMVIFHSYVCLPEGYQRVVGPILRFCGRVASPRDLALMMDEFIDFLAME